MTTNEPKGILAQKNYIYKKGFFVELYEFNRCLEKRKVYKHSESYAENVAENWVDAIISSPSG